MRMTALLAKTPIVRSYRYYSVGYYCIAQRGAAKTVLQQSNNSLQSGIVMASRKNMMPAPTMMRRTLYLSKNHIHHYKIQSTRSSFLPIIQFQRRLQSTANPVAAVTDTPFLLADIGEGIHEVEVLSWHVSTGQTVQQFDNLCTVQSDKATVDITSRYDGTVTRLVANVGDMVQVGTPLLYLQQQNLNKDAAVNSSTSALEVVSKESSTESFVTTTSDDTTRTEQRINQVGAEQLTQRNEDEIVSTDTSKNNTSKRSLRTSPAVRRLLSEHGIVDAGIVATGPGGRLLKRDVLDHLVKANDNIRDDKDDFQTSSSVLDSDSSDSEDEEEMLPLRGYARIMAQTMTASNQIPHMSLSDEIVVNKLRSVLEASDNPPSLLAVFTKACSVALQDYPTVNATVSTSATNDSTQSDKEQLQLQSRQHIGIAMDTKRGLVVPVIKNVQDMSIADIQKTLQSFKTGNELPLDIQPTFSISNVGALGAGLACNPCIAPPQLAMGVLGKFQRLPRFEASDSTEIVETFVLPVTWAGDHRYLDGATLARFHKRVAALVADPYELLWTLQ